MSFSEARRHAKKYWQVCCHPLSCRDIEGGIEISLFGGNGVMRCTESGIDCMANKKTEILIEV